MSDRRFNGIQLGIHARWRMGQRGISEQVIERVLANPTRLYPGATHGTMVAEGTTTNGRRIAIIFSELIDSRGLIAYIVTIYPVRRYR